MLLTPDVARVDRQPLNYSKGRLACSVSAQLFLIFYWVSALQASRHNLGLYLEPIAPGLTGHTFMRKAEQLLEAERSCS